MPQRTPVELFHPGEYLKDELDARGWSQADFAEILGRNVATVSRIISGKAQITVETACLLEDALGMDAQYWLNLESTYQLGKNRQNLTSDLVSRRARIYDKYPVKSLMSRGWIEPTDNIDVLYHRVLTYFEISDIDEKPTFLHAAKKKSDATRTPLQDAWLFRTYHLAKSMQVSRFTKKKASAAIDALKKLVGAPEEIRHIPGILSDAGIRYVIVEPLKGSKIDGACYWLENGKSPVIALSLLWPTLDRFWFNLMHELMHVLHGHGKDYAIIDEDLYREQDVNEEEEIANNEAESWLIPNDTFDEFVMRHNPIFSRQNVTGFARRIHVHPAIVADRLHKKSIIKDWAIHAKLKTNVRKIVVSTTLCDGWGIDPGI